MEDVMIQKSYQITQPDGTQFDYNSLAVSPDGILEEVFRRGITPLVKDLEGWEFKGYNTFDLTHVLGIRKFKKGFYRDGDTAEGELRGYNVKVSLNGLGEDWNDIMQGGKSAKHGWYNAYPVRINEIDNKYLHAFLINYDCDRNMIVDPARLLRDYLVQVYPDNHDMFLGKAFLALGIFRIFVSYFVLERSNPSTL
jgi:hypothetical protein